MARDGRGADQAPRIERSRDEWNDLLPPDRLQQLQQRIREGEHNRPARIRQLARRILESGDLTNSTEAT